MSAHRVIDTKISLEALKDGTVVLDSAGDVLEKYRNFWSATNFSSDSFVNADIVLPARVLIESWER